MGINSESDRAASMVIGPTSLGMVRIYVEADGIELPMDFDPDEALEIAEELRAAAEAARAQTAPRRAGAQSDSRGGAQPESRAGAQSDSRGGAQSDSRAGGHPESRGGAQPGPRAGAQPGSRGSAHTGPHDGADDPGGKAKGGRRGR